MIAALGASTPSPVGLPPPHEMTAGAILDASARVEQGLVRVVAGLVVLALMLALAQVVRRGGRRSDAGEPIVSRRLEIGLLGVILLVALLTRTLGYATGWT